MITLNPVEIVARRISVRGVVQGVGFRPFVHRLAVRHGLTGWVQNTSGDVEIRVEGTAGAIDRFLGRLREEAPPLARVEAVEAIPVVPEGRAGFSIRTSRSASGQRQPIPPDVGICPACAAELADPENRRYRYPFITCTDCGPRYSVIESLPYDRERTTMRVFGQCAECLREYHTPGDRRYHSETNSCPVCGPRLWLELPAARGPAPEGEAAIAGAARMLLEGGIVAVRGVGGFHLAVDATSDAAVERLRERKHREAKPLALMVAGLAQARSLAEVSDQATAVLRSPERPVVVLPRRPHAVLAAAVSPGLDTVGIMLPATPLHQLLLEAVGAPLVMTSGNVSDEPIAIGNAEARERLAPIADAWLLHNREIVARSDDSVVRIACGAPRFVRRSRGYAPLPLSLPVASPRPLLAVGPHLKNTFTLVHGATAWVSPHVGDLESLETLEHFQAMRHAHERIFRIRPEVVVRDLHPGYLSTRLADELAAGPVIPVQHHHAHVAAVMAEHGVTEPVIGVAYDGTGYGTDGTIWGGEILEADLVSFRRVAHLASVPLPGGDLAARTPWRSALGYLSQAPWAEGAFAAAFEGVDPRQRQAAQWQIINRVNCAQTSSMGRLFDAAAAILGVRQVAHFEGQAAMELESLAGRRPAREIRCQVTEMDGRWILDPLPLLIRLGLGRQRGEDVADLAADFHASIAWVTANLVRWAAAAAGLRTVVLAGGVFQNVRLLESLHDRLTALGLRVLLPTRLGANDGAVSYGQAAIGAATLAAG